MPTGWDEVGKEERGESRFLIIDPDTYVTVRVLDEAPYTTFIHRVAQKVKGEDKFAIIQATEDPDDDFIDANSRYYPRRRQHAMRVVVMDDEGDPDDVKVLRGGNQIFGQLKTLYERHGDLREFDIIIKRTGERRDTQYHVSASPSSADIDLDAWVDYMNDLEELEFDQLFPPVTGEEQQRQLTAAGIDIFYDPIAEIAAEMSVEEALETHIPFGQFGPDNYPPHGKTIQEVLAIDAGYVSWIAESATSNHDVAAAAQVAVGDMDAIAAPTRSKKIGPAKKAKSKPRPVLGREEVPEAEEEEETTTEELEWPLSQDPKSYLDRWYHHGGKHVNLALAILESQGTPYGGEEEEEPEPDDEEEEWDDDADEEEEWDDEDDEEEEGEEPEEEEEEEPPSKPVKPQRPSGLKGPQKTIAEAAQRARQKKPATEADRAELEGEIKTIFADEDIFEDPMDIVRLIKKHSGGKTRLGDLSMSELKKLYKALALTTT